MVRRCAVPNCKNTDKIILSHRFPKKTHISTKWAKELNIEHIDVMTLIYNYTVCCLHFEASCYRNPKSNNLNVNAVPTLHPKNLRLNKLDSITACEQDTSGCVSILGNECFSGLDDVDPLDLISYTSFSSPEGSSDSINIDRFQETDMFSDVGMDNDKSCEDNLDHVIDFSEEDQCLEPSIEPSMENYDEADAGYPIVIIDEALSPDVIGDCSNYNEDSNDKESGEVYSIKTSEVATQVDTDELEKVCDADDEYNKLSRADLIERLQGYENLIKEQQEKLEDFQNAHANLLQSMDVFKQLMNNKL